MMTSSCFLSFTSLVSATGFYTEDGPSTAITLSSLQFYVGNNGIPGQTGYVE